MTTPLGKCVALVGVWVADRKRAGSEVNRILGEFEELLVGRMGIVRKESGAGVISLIVEADTDGLGALTGRLGMIPRVKVKSMLLARE